MTASRVFGPSTCASGDDALPLEEEAQEVARGHGLDLRAQPLDRVVMDAGEQPALAPFVASPRPG